jgi:uncharacterized protein (TIGR02271 family)
MNERANLDRLTPGMSVFDALNMAVGPVEAVGAETFRVAGVDLPASTIARVEGDSVYLHLAQTVLGVAAGDAASTAAHEQVVSREEGRIVIPLAEERLAVTTHEVELGEVIIRKRVVEEERMVPVTFRREEVEIIRRGPGEAWPLDTPPEGPDITRIPLQGWEPVVGTEAVTTREVVIEKARIAEDGHAIGAIRRERVEIDETTQVTGSVIRKAAHEQ